MIIIRNNILPFKGYKILNLFGILLVRKDERVTEYDINHENIHTAQMREMLWVFFYLWYGVEYIIVRLFHGKQSESYHDVSFEEEAYNNDQDLGYLSRRKHFAWVKYLKVRSNG